MIEKESDLFVTDFNNFLMPTITHPKAIPYPAEEAELLGGAIIATHHKGFTGRGYISGYYNSGTACTRFTVNVAVKGVYFLSLRYSAGAAGNWSADRTVGVSINGSKPNKVIFKSYDASWDVWADNILLAGLQAGVNSIDYLCLTDNDNSDCINIDKLSIWEFNENPVIDQMIFDMNEYIVSENYTVQTKLYNVDSNGIRTVNKSTVTYSSSDSSIASVENTDGIIKGIKEGRIIITARSNGLTAETTITVAANPVIYVDFKTSLGAVNPSTFGYILTPNYDVPDSRLKLLGPLLNRDTIPAQNFQAIGDLDGSYYPYESSILERCLEAYHRAKSVGYKWYMLFGMSPSWAAPGGGPMDTMKKEVKKTPEQQARFKQYIKDALQYFKDHGAKPDFADLTNEYWTGLEDTFRDNWEALREVFSDNIPAVGPGAVGFAGIPDYYIPYASEQKITIEGPCWHEFWVNDRYATLSQLQNWRNIIAGYQAKYPEVNGKYIIWEENNAGSKNPTDWTRSMANVIRTGINQNIKGCLEPRNANGMSDLITTNVTEANPAARRPIWWVYFMFAQMSGHYISLTTDGSEEFTAAACVDTDEAKVIFAKNSAEGAVHIKLNSLPFNNENVKLDLYKITSMENEGLKYQYSINQKAACDLDLLIDNIGAEESWMLIIKKEEAAPSFFYPLFPDDGEVAVSRPMLSWSEAQGADMYTLIISENSDLSAPVIKEQAIAQTFFTLKTKLIAGHIYYWTVIAYNKYGITPVFNSTVYSFIVGESIDVPGQFGPYLPTVNAKNEAVTPEFKWSTAYNADSYHLVISKNSDMTEPVIDKQGIISIRNTGMYGPSTQVYYIPEQPLEYDTIYYWTVYAVNSYGERPMNGPLHYFTTKAEGEDPKEFKKLQPENAAEKVSARAVLNWELSKNAFFYKLEIADNADMSEPVIVRDRMIYHTYTVEPNILKPDTIYYWRVTAYTKDLRLKAAASDGISSFRTEAVPCSPLLYAEQAGDRRVTLWFRPSVCADSYIIKYGTESGNYTDEITNILNSPVEVTGLINGVNYYFTVIAVNKAGRSSVWNERCAMSIDAKHIH